MLSLIHIFYLKEWFDGSFAAGLEDFDLIGLSYYPFWHGTFTDPVSYTHLDVYKRQVVTLSHRAYSKGVFGKGAVEAAKFLAGKPAGMYDMQDVIAAK